LIAENSAHNKLSQAAAGRLHADASYDNDRNCLSNISVRNHFIRRIILRETPFTMSIEAPMTGNADGTKASVLPAAKRFSKTQALRELLAFFCDTTTLTSLCRVDKGTMCAAVQVLYQTVSNDRIRDILEAVVDDVSVPPETAI
jgi:hypothetical protein